MAASRRAGRRTAGGAVRPECPGQQQQTGDGHEGDEGFHGAAFRAVTMSRRSTAGRRAGGAAGRGPGLRSAGFAGHGRGRPADGVRVDPLDLHDDPVRNDDPDAGPEVLLDELVRTAVAFRGTTRAHGSRSTPPLPSSVTGLIVAPPTPDTAAVDAYTSPRGPEWPAAGRGDHGRSSVAVNPAFTAAVANVLPRSSIRRMRFSCADLRGGDCQCPAPACLPGTCPGSSVRGMHSASRSTTSRQARCACRGW